MASAGKHTTSLFTDTAHITALVKITSQFWQTLIKYVYVYFSANDNCHMLTYDKIQLMHDIIN